MNSFKKYLWKRKVQNVLKNKKREKKIIGFDQIKSFAIVSKIDNINDIKHVDIIVDSLKNNNIDVVCKLIYNKKEIANWIDVSYSESIILAKDLNYYKIPKKNVLNDFYNTKFDVLVNFNTMEDLTSDFITANSKANLILGMKIEKNNLFADIQIDTHKENFINELKKYLNMLSK